MKIIIPKEYEDRFTKETLWLNLKNKNCCTTKEYAIVFVSCWKDGVLLMNDKEYKTLEKGLEELDMNEKEGIKRFVRAGIIEVIYLYNGSIDIPEVFAERIMNKPYKIRVEHAGLVIC